MRHKSKSIIFCTSTGRAHRETRGDHPDDHPTGSGRWIIVGSRFRRHLRAGGKRSDNHAAAGAADERRYAIDAGAQAAPFDARIRRPSAASAGIVRSAMGCIRGQPSLRDRTAPYWRHIMVIDVYAAMVDGVWFYDPKAHLLRKHLSVDIRAATGQQDFVGSAPLNLVYVAHGERMHDVPPEGRRLYASVDTGFIGQNVYLFCASEGLASVFSGAVDYKKLEKVMQLEGEQFVTFAQTVGYPKSRARPLTSA